MNSLEYGALTFGDLGDRFPEVLGGMTTRRAGVDFGRLAAAYLGALKAVRKLAGHIKASKGAVAAHFANVPIIAETLDLEPGTVPNTATAIVPSCKRSVTRTKLHVTPTVALEDGDQFSSWTEGLQASLLDNDLCKFYSTHLKFIASVLKVLVKYVPVLFLYAMVVGTVLTMFILGSNPDALFDLVLFLLSLMPEYMGFFVKRLLARFAQRIATSLVPGDFSNSTAFDNLEPPNSTVGLAASFTIMYLAMLWRAPRA